MIRISKLMAFADWIKELYSLVCACSYDELRFCKVAYIHDRRVVSINFSMIWNLPWWSWLKELNHIFLNIPYQNFKLTLMSCIVFCICIFIAFLKFMRSWYIRIWCAWERTFWWLILFFTKIFFTWYQAATLGNEADWRWILIFMAF